MSPVTLLAPAPAGDLFAPPPRPAAPAEAARARVLARPESVHPALWRAQAGGQAAAVLPSGFAALDAELPGGGWPLRCLTDLLLPGPGLGELRLLAPALARLAQAGRTILLADPPAQPSAAGLAQIGLPPSACLVLRSRAPGLAHRLGTRGRWRPGAPRLQAGGPEPSPPQADLGWALEQALRSGQLGAVLAWTATEERSPDWRPEALRRLQLAAQAHEGPVFLLRAQAAESRPSPAPLRLRLHAAPSQAPDRLGVQLIKRRGAAHEAPLWLALQPVLSARAQARAAQPWDPEAPLHESAAQTPAEAVVG